MGSALAAAVAAALPLRDAFSRMGRGGVFAPATPLVGVNALNPITYYDTVFPFLNILKHAASNTSWEPWFTSVLDGTLDTGEEAYLQLDANQNVTSLVAGNGFSGTQTFNCAQTYIFRVDSLATGATYYYPPGPYTLSGQGGGAFQLGGDVTASTIASSSSGISISGSTVTSTASADETWTVTFNCNTQTETGGIHITVTAVATAGSNYCQFLYCVPTAYLSNYLAGEILHPAFKASVLGTGLGFTGYNAPVRFMQALNTFGQEIVVTFSANLAESATSGTVSSFVDANGSSATWNRPSGTYYIVFATGQTAEITCTYGSSAVTWNTALSAAVDTTAIGAMGVIALGGTWAQRPLPGKFSWSGDVGIPFEVAIQCANELGLPPWLCIPATANIIDSTYATNLAQLTYNGTGASLSGWNVTAFNGVTAGLLPRVEYSNETWNSTYKAANLMQMMSVPSGFYAAQGDNQYYGGQEYYGTQIAGICNAFSAVYGSSFSTGVRIVCMNQFAAGQGPDFLKVAMNTPDWTSRAYAAGIGAIGCAPYFGTDSINATDAATIFALSNPVNEMFSLAYSATGVSGNTYSSLNGEGWVQSSIETMQTWASQVEGQPWSSLPLECYEGGSALDDANDIEASVSGWRVNVLVATQNDSRFAQIGYDPNHTLSSTYNGYWPQMKAAGVSFICQLCGCSGELTATSVPGGASWGAIQSTMQVAAASDLAALPSKYQGIMDYVNGIA